MVEEHRSQTDLSPATAVVLSLHSSKHTQLAARWGLTLWRRIPPSRWISSSVSQAAGSLKIQRQTHPEIETGRYYWSCCRRSDFIFRISKHLKVWSPWSLNLDRFLKILLRGWITSDHTRASRSRWFSFCFVWGCKKYLTVIQYLDLKVKFLEWKYK